MAIKTNRQAYLISAQAANGAGPVTDARATRNYGYLWYQASGQSGIFTLQGSHNATAWMPIATYTATATQTGTAQIAGYFPYVRVNVDGIYSGAGKTGTLWVHYAPGVL